MTNQTIVFEVPERVTVEERAIPEPDAGEVLVETERTMISTGTELTILGGEYPSGSRWDDYDYPFDPGYNNVGTVIETGSGVSTPSIGQRVGTYGRHSEYVVVDADHCRPVPDDVPVDEAVFFTIAEIVMNGVRRGRITWGESVAVFGLGLLGQLATQICRFAGARPVFAVDLSDSRLDYVPIESRVRTVDAGKDDPADAIAADGDGGVDVAFEVTGNEDAITGELDAVREQGRLVVLSSPRGETTFDFHDYCNGPSYEIIGAHNNSHPSTATVQNPWTQHRHAELFFELLREGELNISGLISHSRPFEDAPALYEMLLEDRTDAMGVLLEW